MGKHKKKRTRRKKKQVSPRAGIRDKHHLCYQRRKWSRGNLSLLRDYWYCRVSLPRDTIHKAIHCEIPDIPVPKDRSAKEALEQLGYLEKYGSITEFDSAERRLEILASLFDCSDQPTADAFRAQIEVVRRLKKAPL